MATRAELTRRYIKKHKKLHRPRSLHPKLHLPFSMGMERGFTNLGTYADKPGDHGYYPARAFDLGHPDRFRFKGWQYIKARVFALLLIKNHKALDIDYVILGRVIWSRRNGFRPYTRDTSHDFHIHVSMYWPGKWDN